MIRAVLRHARAYPIETAASFAALLTWWGSLWLLWIALEGAL